MRNDHSNRTFTIGLFVFLGLLIGVMAVNALDRGGMQYLFIAAIVLIIAVLIMVMRMYSTRQKSSDMEQEGGNKDTEVGFVVDTFHDLVSKLKEKEEELERLRASAEERAMSVEAYNENILQSVPSGVVTIDDHLKIKTINRSASEILGVIQHELIGKDFREVFKEPFRTLSLDDSTVWRSEYPYKTVDGRDIWLGISSSELKNSAGEKIGLIFIFTDLTDIKGLQAQVELKQRLSQLGEMSAGIAHELRNSMSVISGYAKLLGKKVEQSCVPAVDSIQSEVGTMDRIISELLAFAKPSVLNKEEIDLGNMIKDISGSLMSERQSVKISIDCDDGIYIKADKVLLRQAFSNLIINALEALGEGGAIDIAVRSSGEKVIAAFKDNGSGIPENILHKIFLPFYTTKEGGTGFGLALVQKIIVSHGGTIDVESVEGDGSIFKVTLPV